MHRVIGHATINIVGDGAGALCGVGEGAADSDLVAGLGDGVDEGVIGTPEEGVHEGGVVQERALQEGDIWEGLELFGDEALEGVDLRAHRISDGGRDADERRRLSPGRVDHGYRLLRLCHSVCEGVVIGIGGGGGLVEVGGGGGRTREGSFSKGPAEEGGSG